MLVGKHSFNIIAKYDLSTCIDLGSNNIHTFMCIHGHNPCVCKLFCQICSYNFTAIHAHDGIYRFRMFIFPHKFFRYQLRFCVATLYRCDIKVIVDV